MSGRFEWFDLRPGGGYRLVLTYADAESAHGKATIDTDIVDARFVEIVTGERVVQQVEFESGDPDFAGTMAMTWSMTAANGGTLVEIRADDVPRGISAGDHAAGLASSLANLAEYLVCHSGASARPSPGPPRQPTHAGHYYRARGNLDRTASTSSPAYVAGV